jgi:endoribonuclease Dicer
MEAGLPVRPSKSLPSAFWDICDILHDFESFFSDNPITDEIPITIDLEWCTPKLRALVDILLAHRSPTFQGIVFVEQRQIAGVLAKVLPAISQLKGVIRSAALVGQGVGLDGVSKATGDNQVDAVGQFRRGDINLRSYFDFLLVIGINFYIISRRYISCRGRP